jgi:hypothetical protein
VWRLIGWDYSVEQGKKYEYHVQQLWGKGYAINTRRLPTRFIRDVVIGILVKILVYSWLMEWRMDLTPKSVCSNVKIFGTVNSL